MKLPFNLMLNKIAKKTTIHQKSFQKVAWMRYNVSIVSSFIRYSIEKVYFVAFCDFLLMVYLTTCFVGSC